MDLEKYLNESDKKEISTKVEEENKLAKTIVELEKTITEQELTLKQIKEKRDNSKKQLLGLMEERGVKSWETPNGIKITYVAGKKPTSKSVATFNSDKLKEDDFELYKKYLVIEDKQVSGRKAYLKITLPKES